MVILSKPMTRSTSQLKLERFLEAAVSMSTQLTVGQGSPEAQVIFEESCHAPLKPLPFLN